jgi:hypothetical protein
MTLTAATADTVTFAGGNHRTFDDGVEVTATGTFIYDRATLRLRHREGSATLAGAWVGRTERRKTVAPSLKWIAVGDVGAENGVVGCRLDDRPDGIVPAGEALQNFRLRCVPPARGRVGGGEPIDPVAVDGHQTETRPPPPALVHVPGRPQRSTRSHAAPARVTGVDRLRGGRRPAANHRAQTIRRHQTRALDALPRFQFDEGRFRGVAARADGRTEPDPVVRDQIDQGRVQTRTVESENPRGKARTKLVRGDGGQHATLGIAYLQPLGDRAPADHLRLDAADAKGSDRVRLQHDACSHRRELRGSLEHPALTPSAVRKGGEGQSPNAAARDEERCSHVRGQSTWPAISVMNDLRSAGRTRAAR